MRASQAAYLAGFLDGDGSIHLQLVRQQEYKFGFYIRTSMSFSQAPLLGMAWKQSRSSSGAAICGIAVRV